MAEKNKGEKEKSVKCPIWVVQDTEKMCGMGWKKEHFQWNEILLGAASSREEREVADSSPT